MLRHFVRSGIGLATAGLCFIAAAPALAEEPAAKQKSVTEQVLEILRAQGTIDNAQYEALKRQAAEEERARQQQGEAAQKTEVAEASTAATTPDPEGWKIYFKDYLRIERNDGLYKFHIGGRIQYDIGGISTDQDLKDEGFNNQGTGEEFRRARLGIDGNLGEYALFKAEYDFAGGDADFADVYVGMHRLPYVGTFLAGHFKEPVSLDELTSSKYSTFMERALPVQAFAPGRNSGVGISNSAFDERMTWSVGGYRDADSFGDGFSNQSPYDVTARVTGLPVWEDDGRTLVHVGYSYSHEFRDNENVSFEPDPEVHFSDAIITTGDILSHGVDLFGFELATVQGPLSLQGEFLDALVDQQHGGNVNFWGAYGQVSWFLTGENRPYDQKSGSFGRVHPNNPFSISKHQWGALELASRYSYVNLNDDDVRGGIESNVTAGVNWYLYSDLRLMLNYVWAHRNDVGDQNAVMTRFAVDF
jgi:phosphate-selective porin OprO/OprP